MRARILAARQKTTEYRRNTSDDGTRVRRNPLRINPVSLNPRFRRRRRRLPARRKRDVVRHSLYGGLQSRVLERWPRITVRECRKRPARHSTRAARYKRCRGAGLSSLPGVATNYLPFCDDAGDKRYRSALRSRSRQRCEPSHYDEENLSRYLRMRLAHFCKFEAAATLYTFCIYIFIT